MVSVFPVAVWSMFLSHHRKKSEGLRTTARPKKKNKIIVGSKEEWQSERESESQSHMPWHVVRSGVGIVCVNLKILPRWLPVSGVPLDHDKPHDTPYVAFRLQVEMNQGFTQKFAALYETLIHRCIDANIWAVWWMNICVFILGFVYWYYEMNNTENDLVDLYWLQHLAQSSKIFGYCESIWPALVIPFWT